MLICSSWKYHVIHLYRRIFHESLGAVAGTWWMDKPMNHHHSDSLLLLMRCYRDGSYSVLFDPLKKGLHAPYWRHWSSNANAAPCEEHLHWCMMWVMKVALISYSRKNCCYIGEELFVRRTVLARPGSFSTFFTLKKWPSLVSFMRGRASPCSSPFPSSTLPHFLQRRYS